MRIQQPVTRHRCSDRCGGRMVGAAGVRASSCPCCRHPASWCCSCRTLCCMVDTSMAHLICCADGQCIPLPDVAPFLHLSLLASAPPQTPKCSSKRAPTCHMTQTPGRHAHCALHAAHYPARRRCSSASKADVAALAVQHCQQRTLLRGLKALSATRATYTAAPYPFAAAASRSAGAHPWAC